MKILYILSIFIVIFIKSYGQTINMSTSSQTISCPGSVTFYDDNGTGNYTNSKDYTLTVTAATAGQCLSVTFSAFGTESCCDNLKYMMVLERAEHYLELMLAHRYHLPQQHLQEA